MRRVDTCGARHDETVIAIDIDKARMLGVDAVAVVRALDGAGDPDAIAALTVRPNVTVRDVARISREPGPSCVARTSDGGSAAIAIVEHGADLDKLALVLAQAHTKRVDAPAIQTTRFAVAGIEPARAAQLAGEALGDLRGRATWAVIELEPGEPIGQLVVGADAPIPDAVAHALDHRFPIISLGGALELEVAVERDAAPAKVEALRARHLTAGCDGCATAERPELRVEVDRPRAADMNVNVADVAELLQLAMPDGLEVAGTRRPADRPRRRPRALRCADGRESRQRPRAAVGGRARGVRGGDPRAAPR